MKNKFILIKIVIVYFVITTKAFSQDLEYFNKGVDLFKKKELDKSKILFERDIVFYPKNDRSYLYLAKIFKKKDDDELQEINLENVLLLNPNNDEALYMMIDLKIKQSNYQEAKVLINKFSLVCKSFCSKQDELENKFAKLTPENAEE